MSGSKKLKVVCVGAGYFSQYHYDAWHRLADVSLAGVCNRSVDRAAEFAEKYSIPHYGGCIREVLKATEPDVVDIITPPETHLASVKAAAAMGVDAICQKPFGENLKQAEEMVLVAEEAGIKLIIHENFRFMPWFRQIKQILDSGFAGKILNARFSLRPGDGQGEDAYLARQPYFQTMEKFLVHETAIHLVDTFRYLFGNIKSVYAHLRRCNPVIKGEDSGLIIFEHHNNMQAVFDGNRLLDHASSNTRRTMGELLIEGTQGCIRLDGEGRIWQRAFGEQEEKQVGYNWADQNFGGDCVYNLIEHITKHYVHGGELENQGKEFVQNIVIENAIYHSYEERKVVHIK